ncbi:hypothetical protein [Aeoliella mucimassa]|uniref:Uncharacterized protein n=1 Tax=Aeoliella mucimassa TaxID=2527972 RepID=A0A518AH24_9BACT|nr:hypothetical protein [Aeoliella mucimassa]QDU54009.1 hypothetical protein Pan181_01890 [Aeoliella mucimassa]
MRFGIRSLLIVSALLAVGISLVRFAWHSWPSMVISVSFGLLLGLALNVLRVLKERSSEMPRGLLTGMFLVAAGIAVAEAFIDSPSKIGCFVGLVVYGGFYFTWQRWLPGLLAACGLENA